MTVIHATFDLSRDYPVAVPRVFAAWADPVAKARWFAGPDASHELDFRVGGQEVNRGSNEGGPPLTFESVYRDIVPDTRIVYTSTLHTGSTLTTVSLTTVEFVSEGEGGTRLRLTEQGTYLDGHEEPAWRKQGTSDWLAALGADLLRTDL
jgi:uncharacterized protein YndB with AHSA1/START domain